jgi:hypothetical protein
MKVAFSKSRAQSTIAIGRVSGKHTWLRFGEGHEIHFWDSEPIAVFSGGCIWFRSAPSGAVTKMLASLEPRDAPRINQSAAEFDFTIGQVLTLAGLPLTRIEK